MNNETILKKAIEKAIKNGWKVPDEVRFYPVLPKGEYWGGPPVRYRRFKELGYKKIGHIELTQIDIYSIIFSHDFAKCFWQGNQIEDCWQFHLQKMVLEPNPLDYVAKFL